MIAPSGNICFTSPVSSHLSVYCFFLKKLVKKFKLSALLKEKEDTEDKTA